MCRRQKGCWAHDQHVILCCNCKGIYASVGLGARPAADPMRMLKLHIHGYLTCRWPCWRGLRAQLTHWVRSMPRRARFSELTQSSAAVCKCVADGAVASKLCKMTVDSRRRGYAKECQVTNVYCKLGEGVSCDERSRVVGCAALAGCVRRSRLGHSCCRR